MEQNIIRKRPNLFPRYFKKIGLLLTAISIATLIYIKERGNVDELSEISVFKIIAQNGVLLGLFLIGWSKDKIDDELSISLRLKSASFAFIWGVLYCLISPIFELIFRDSIQEPSGPGLLLSMLLIHILTYHLYTSNR